MEVQQMMKDMITNHKAKVQLFQWAFMNGVASLVYSDYLYNIRQQQVPTRRIFVPPIREVNRFLDSKGPYITHISEHLVDEMVNDHLFKQYLACPELEILSDENIEVFKTVVSVYMIPNVIRRLPETIKLKFQLDDPSNQLFIEDTESKVFYDLPDPEECFKFTLDQTILQLLITLPSVIKDIKFPESNKSVTVTNDQVVTIGNEQAVCPIHFDRYTITPHDQIMKIICFVTNTTFVNDNIETYTFDSGLFNQISLTKFNGIRSDING